MQATRVHKEEVVNKEGLTYVENPAGEKLLLSGGESAAQARSPVPTTPILKSSGHEANHSHNRHDHDHHYNELEHHHKKSVLAKVREKAKKWKQVLTKKKHGHEGEGNMTPTTPINLDVDDEGVDQDPEYYGAPMYESETAPKMYKERAQRRQASAPSPKTLVHDHSSKPVLDHCPVIDLRPTNLVGAPPTAHSREPNTTFHHSEATGEPKLHHLNSFKESSTEPNSMFPANSHTLVTETKVKEGETDNVKLSNKTLSETVTEILAPAYNAVSDATSKIAATIQSPVDETGAKMMWDKGISVREYLLQKLEPGAEDKALSEVITEAISPKNLEEGEELSVVEKVKGAVSSLLGKEEQQMENQEVKIHRTSRPLFKQSEDGSILSPKDLYQQASMARDGHGVLSKGNVHAHKVTILEPKHGRGGSSPLPVSTNPSMVVPALKNSSTVSMSMNQPAVSVSAVSVSTNSHAGK